MKTSDNFFSPSVDPSTVLMLNGFYQLHLVFVALQRSDGDAGIVYFVLSSLTWTDVGIVIRCFVATGDVVLVITPPPSV